MGMLFDMLFSRHNNFENEPGDNMDIVQTGMDRRIERKKWPRRRLLFWGGIALAVIVVVSLFLFADTRSSLNVEQDKISIATAKSGPFQEFIPVTGTVQPIKTVYMDALDGGQVKAVYVEEGAFVKQGDSLLRMDNTNVQMEMMFREADLYDQMNNLRATRLAMEQNRLTLSQQAAEVAYQINVQKRNFERAEVLKEKGMISDEEYQNAKDDFDYWSTRQGLIAESQRQDSIMRQLQIEQLEQSIERMQKNVGIVKEKFDNLVVRAPISGQLTSLNAEIGELKSSGSRLGQIDVLDSYKLRAAVDEYYITRIAPGLAADCEIGDQSYRLSVKKVYPEVRNNRFDIDLVFDGDVPKGIRRGQSIQVRLALGEPTTALIIPRGGFYQTTGGNWIYVVDKGGDYAVRRTIKIGRQNPTSYEVLEGLEPGERVITSSYDNFGDFEKLVLK
jgi:HlyD family secretion protein